MNSEENNKNKSKKSSEHRCKEEGIKKKPRIEIMIKEEVKEEAIKEEVEDKGDISDREDILDVCEGYPDSVYPTPLVIEDQIPDDHPLQVNQELPPEDEWYCQACGKPRCQFVQWQEELETIVSIMHPEASNVAKRFHMYRHMSHKLHGPLAKGERKRLPECFENGLRELYPSGKYKGYNPGPHSILGRR
jgi:RNA polymerase subunit RPABC4/transcription elongation factor Spt4